MSLTFCICEDRVAEEAGVRLAIASLRRHSPTSDIVVYRPNATAAFSRWVEAMGKVTLIGSQPAGASSWNCKPHALLPLLREGRQNVVWVDSDIIAARSCDAVFHRMRDDEIGICEEYRAASLQGSDLRVRGWGFTVGRSFPRTLNTAVLRVTPRHVPLLERWQELLSDPSYAASQVIPLHKRPAHQWGDQDVLNALLGSAEFADVPVHLLKTGKDIAHCSSATSYSLGERVGGLLGPIPVFLHAQGAKPWVVLDADRIRRAPEYASKSMMLIQEMSPYFAVSTSYRDSIGMRSEWMDYKSTAGRLLKLVGFGHFAVAGLPLTVAATAAKALKRLLA
jgi:hypothetical protein